MSRTRFARAALIAGTALLLSGQVFAQGTGNGAWFMPGQPPAAGQHTTGRAAKSRSHTPSAAEPATAPAAAAEEGAAGAEQPAVPAAPVRMQLPPPPVVPDIPRGAMPPAAVIGVISIPDVLRASEAYRAADKMVGERRQKLNEDAQKEQVALRDLGQQLANERSKLSADQIRAKEKELQDRIAESRRAFSERGRIIQEASQYALAQIERTLSDVVQKVAAAHGMNLVLQRAEVALNQAEFDITAEVANLLNKTLPSVVIPPDGVPPPIVAASATTPAPTPTAASSPAHAEHGRTSSRVQSR